MYALGIDVGSGHARVAVWRGGTVAVRPARQPSTVLVTAEGDLVAGPEAPEHAARPGTLVIPDVLSLIGRPDAIEAAGARFSAEQVVATLLRSLVDEAARAEGGPPAAVTLTHPADWGTFRTNLLSWAATLADLQAEGVQLVTHAEAAAVEAGHRTGVREDGVFAVHDLGARTTSAALMRRTAVGVDTLGDPVRLASVGAGDLDDLLLVHVLEAAGADGAPGPDELAALLERCAAAKERLSTAPSAVVPVLLADTGALVEVEVSRAEFEALTAEAVDRSAATVESALAASGLDPADLEAVVSVGGGAHIPAVRAALERRLGLTPVVWVSPEHAVVQGAARIAGGYAAAVEAAAGAGSGAAAAHGDTAGIGPGAPVPGTADVPQAGPEPGRGVPDDDARDAADDAAPVPVPVDGTVVASGATAVPRPPHPRRRRRRLAVAAAAGGTAVAVAAAIATVVGAGGSPSDAAGGPCAASRVDGAWVCVTSAVLDAGVLALELTTGPEGEVVAAGERGAGGAGRIEVFGSDGPEPTPAPAAVVGVERGAEVIALRLDLRRAPAREALAGAAYACARVAGAADPAADCAPIDGAPAALPAAGGATPPGASPTIETTAGDVPTAQPTASTGSGATPGRPGGRPTRGPGGTEGPGDPVPTSRPGTPAPTPTGGAPVAPPPPGPAPTTQAPPPLTSPPPPEPTPTAPATTTPSPSPTVPPPVSTASPTVSPPVPSAPAAGLRGVLPLP